MTLIYGINHTAFDFKKHKVLSAASCTTTGLAHMIKPLLNTAATSKILTASMSTVHAVTNSQSILDKTPKAGEKDMRKNRSTLNNIILTSTNAAAALIQVIPEVKDIGFMADSIRVPTNTESLIVLNCTFQTRAGADGKKEPVTTKLLNEIYQKAADNDPEHLVIFTMEQNVSGPHRTMPPSSSRASSIHKTPSSSRRRGIPNVPEELLKAAPKGNIRVPVVHAKIFGWYDNEYGSYTNRMGDLSVYVHKSMA